MKKIGELWRNMPDYDFVLCVSDYGKIKNLITDELLDTSEGWVWLYKGFESKRFFISDLVQTAFSKKENSDCNKHIEILAGLFELKFRHFIKTPLATPDDSFNSYKLWFVEDGFICCSPLRSFMQGNCKFVFPYEVAGERCYMCRFDEIQPLKYRQKRNSGKIQIFGNKTPFKYRDAIAIVYKRLTQAVELKSKWIEGYTKLKYSYINNAIFNTRGCINPIVSYNGTVYILFVDFRALHAEYRELIPKEHLDSLCTFIEKEMKNDLLSDELIHGRQKLWSDAFGFKKSEFIKLVVDNVN